LDKPGMAPEDNKSVTVILGLWSISTPLKGSSNHDITFFSKKNNSPTNLRIMPSCLTSKPNFSHPYDSAVLESNSMWGIEQNLLADWEPSLAKALMQLPSHSCR
jgi:hypothetical protein